MGEEMERMADNEGVTCRVYTKETVQSELQSLPGTDKPSFEELCRNLGATMARMNWLHRLFESYLGEDSAGEARICGYPEDPASLTVEQMRGIMSDVRPDMGEAEFLSRFQRIDQDGSGLVEFDEFVCWLVDDEVSVGGGKVKSHLPCHELAELFDVSEDLIDSLHSEFKANLPDGVEDNYPEEPAVLSKSQAFALVRDLNPWTEEAELEAQVSSMVFSEARVEFEFDTFLELIDFDDLALDENGTLTANKLKPRP